MMTRADVLKASYEAFEAIRRDAVREAVFNYPYRPPNSFISRDEIILAGHPSSEPFEDWQKKDLAQAIAYYAPWWRDEANDFSSAELTVRVNQSLMRSGRRWGCFRPSGVERVAGSRRDRLREFVFDNPWPTDGYGDEASENAAERAYYAPWWQDEVRVLTPESTDVTNSSLMRCDGLWGCAEENDEVTG